MLLVVTLGLSAFISESYAESILVEFDKPEYNTGEKLTISGYVTEFSMPIIAISIYDPNDQILSANNLELDSEGKFSKSIFLDSPFYDLPGDYKVKINYKKISQEEFFTISGDVAPPEPIPEQIIPEIVLLATEKEVYTDGETIEITGIVSAIESPTVLIGIYDPFGTPAGFYFGTIDDTFLFSTSFLAKAGVNFKIDGIYSIKAHYAESEMSTNFEFYESLHSLEDTKPSDNNTKPSDNNTKPSDNNTKPSDNNTKPSDNNTKPSDKNKNNTPSKNNPTIIVENNPKDQKNNSQQNDNSIIKTSEQKESSSSTDLPKTKSKEGNLTVEDIELGKILNQINLECDRSKYSDTISYYDGMGPALYRLCKFENSIQFFDETLSKDPKNIEALVNKGSALRKLGYPNDAISYFDRALKIDSNFVPAINNKANALAILGKYDEAVSLYAQALGKTPSYFTARQNMELVLSEMPQNISPVREETTLIMKNNSNEDSITIYEPTWTSNSSERKNGNSIDFFDQIGSVFSSLGSLFGISNWFFKILFFNKPIKPRVIDCD